jgi:hypothetical protein
MEPAARDEAVRRLRAESARRVERQDRRRTVSSWCALATMVAGLSLMALEADRARLRELRAPQVARQGTLAERIRSDEDQSRLDARGPAARRAAEEARPRAEIEAERARLRALAAEAMVLREPVIEAPRKRGKPRVISFTLSAGLDRRASVRPEPLDALLVF